MFRLLGFLIGSALSIGALFLFLGLPKLTALSQPEILEQLEPISQHATEVKEEVVELAEEVANEIRAAIEKLPPVMNEFAREDALDVPGTVLSANGGEELTKVPGTPLMANEFEEFEIESKPAAMVTLEEQVQNLRHELSTTRDERDAALGEIRALREKLRAAENTQQA